MDSQIISGLQCLHCFGIVHRDLRILNLVLSSDYKRVLICDLEGHWGNRLAPEIAKHDTLDAGWTEKSDIYALGYLIKCMIYGNIPITNLVEWNILAQGWNSRCLYLFRSEESAQFERAVRYGSGQPSQKRARERISLPPKNDDALPLFQPCLTSSPVLYKSCGRTTELVGRLLRTIHMRPRWSKVRKVKLGKVE